MNMTITTYIIEIGIAIVATTKTPLHNEPQ
jgi:hypothetical protein